MKTSFERNKDVKVLCAINLYQDDKIIGCLYVEDIWTIHGIIGEIIQLLKNYNQILVGQTLSAEVLAHRFFDRSDLKGFLHSWHRAIYPNSLAYAKENHPYLHWPDEYDQDSPGIIALTANDIADARASANCYVNILLDEKAIGVHEFFSALSPEEYCALMDMTEDDYTNAIFVELPCKPHRFRFNELEDFYEATEQGAKGFMYEDSDMIYVPKLYLPNEYL